MKLLLYSHYFSPSVGGVETVVLALAKGLANRLSPSGSPAFEITLVTETPTGDVRDSIFPFRVIRQPSSSQLRRLIREADVVHVAGTAIAPIIWSSFAAKPVVVEHHGFQTICPTGQLFQEPQNVPCPGHFMAGNHGACLRCCRATYSALASFRLWLLTFVRRHLCKFVLGEHRSHHVACELAQLAPQRDCSSQSASRSSSGANRWQPRCSVHRFCRPSRLHQRCPPSAGRCPHPQRTQSLIRDSDCRIGARAAFSGSTRARVATVLSYSFSGTLAGCGSHPSSGTCSRCRRTLFLVGKYSVWLSRKTYCAACPSLLRI